MFHTRAKLFHTKPSYRYDSLSLSLSLRFVVCHYSTFKCCSCAIVATLVSAIQNWHAPQQWGLKRETDRVHLGCQSEYLQSVLDMADKMEIAIDNAIEIDYSHRTVPFSSFSVSFSFYFPLPIHCRYSIQTPHTHIHWIVSTDRQNCTSPLPNLVCLHTFPMHFVFYIDVSCAQYRAGVSGCDGGGRGVQIGRPSVCYLPDLYQLWQLVWPNQIFPCSCVCEGWWRIVGGFYLIIPTTGKQETISSVPTNQKMTLCVASSFIFTLVKILFLVTHWNINGQFGGECVKWSILITCQPNNSLFINLGTNLKTTNSVVYVQPPPQNPPFPFLPNTHNTNIPTINQNCNYKEMFVSFQFSFPEEISKVRAHYRLCPSKGCAVE